MSYVVTTGLEEKKEERERVDLSEGYHISGWRGED